VGVPAEPSLEARAQTEVVPSSVSVSQYIPQSRDISENPELPETAEIVSPFLFQNHVTGPVRTTGHVTLLGSKPKIP